MPIVRIGTDLVYYAHVPKCAGSSVEAYLAERFGPLAFLHKPHYTRPPALRWSATSPQHIAVTDLDILFPPGFFRASFAVVRHPARRILSAYAYHQDRRRIALWTPFDRWLAQVSRGRDRAPFVYDNHPRPMADLVPEDAAVFRLEDGLDPLVDWLDGIAGDRGGPRRIEASNTQDDGWRTPKKPWKRWLKARLRARPPVLDEAFCRKIHALYEVDYDRFGYGIYDPLETRR